MSALEQARTVKSRIEQAVEQVKGAGAGVNMCIRRDNLYWMSTRYRQVRDIMLSVDRRCNSVYLPGKRCS